MYKEKPLINCDEDDGQQPSNEELQLYDLYEAVNLILHNQQKIMRDLDVLKTGRLAA